MEKKLEELILDGTTISPGIAIGKIFLYHDILTRDISSYSITRQDVPYELRRITEQFVGSVRRKALDH